MTNLSALFIANSTPHHSNRRKSTSMPAEKIDGKIYAEGLRRRVAEAVSVLKSEYGYQPTLAVVLVGDDPASHVYVRNKIKFTLETGMRSVEHRCDAEIAEDELIALVRTLNSDETVDGILVQLPLPGGLNSDRVIAEIDPDKDVDGLTEVSAGRLSLGKTGIAALHTHGLCHARQRSAR